MGLCFIGELEHNKPSLQMDKVNHILQLFQDSREPYVKKYLTVKLRDDGAFLVRLEDI